MSHDVRRGTAPTRAVPSASESDDVRAAVAELGDASPEALEGDKTELGFDLDPKDGEPSVGVIPTVVDRGSVLSSVAQTSEAQSLVEAPPPCKPPEATDVIADRYRIEEKIAEGGMGVVYRATQLQLNRRVALKTLRPKLLHDPRVERRFCVEAEALARIRHGSTVTIHDYGSTSDGLLYIVMEYLEGKTLSKLILEEGPLPFARILLIGLQVARALRAAHNEGILHRDLKPANIIVTRDEESRDEAKVVDFGLASFMQSQEDNEVPQSLTNSRVGTPAYMAPEQILGQDIDHRVDIYAFGVVLFYMCTGVPPFPGPRPIEVARHHLDTPPPPLASVGYGREVHPSVASIVERCLQKRREDRFASGTELVDAIKEALASSDIERATNSDPDPSPEPGLMEAAFDGEIQGLEPGRDTTELPPRPEDLGRTPRGWVVGLSLAAASTVLYFALAGFEIAPDVRPVAPLEAPAVAGATKPALRTEPAERVEARLEPAPTTVVASTPGATTSSVGLGTGEAAPAKLSAEIRTSPMTKPTAKPPRRVVPTENERAAYEVPLLE
ncbi:MAG: protein kinase [Deltaproteobacteria bacterium]|nr:protein kinase [Deltaproteobacteria bacterium]